MGILDDAIREHLELKRAHGANDNEIRRQEAEAFGPIRQEAATAAADPGVTDLPTEHYEVEPAAEDPYAVHPGDEPVPDPHDHSRAAGSDPAWGDDTELFSEPPADRGEGHAPPAAEAGAGTMEPTGHHADPGPPAAPHHDHAEEPHPALHDHDAIHSEEHAPEPVFRRQPEQRAETPAAPDAPLEPSPVEDPPVGDPPVEHPEIDEPPPRQSHEPAEAGDEDVLEETPEFLQDAPEHDRLWFEQKPPRDFDFGE